MTKILLILKDFSESGADRFFIYFNNSLKEISALEVSDDQDLLVCHDYWAIAPAIMKIAGRIPIKVVDLCEFCSAISGRRSERKLKDVAEVKAFLLNRKENEIVDDAESQREIDLISSYLDIYYKRSEFDENNYYRMAKLMEAKWHYFNRLAQDLDEVSRQYEVEIPVFNVLYKHHANGIRIDLGKLRMHKENIQYDYYKSLMAFSEKFNLPLESPSDRAIKKYLTEKGFSFDEATLDYILEFVPTVDGFCDAVNDIRKAKSSMNLLSALPLSKQFSNPIIDTFGSITSRIYFKDPVFQNISKKYRDIIIAQENKMLTYVDYDQFEVGIMAALSDDNNLKSLYEEDDLYLKISVDIFGSNEKRGLSKKLFLSYAYGMKTKNLVDAAYSQGAKRATVNQFFKQFSRFEEWKKSKQDEYEQMGKIGSIQGNYLRRDRSGPLSEKEGRSCISQVVQGTGSLIFKKALISIDNTNAYRIVLPMHDAILVEHVPDKDTSDLLTLLSDVMTSTLSNKIKGKASVDNFFKP